MADIHDIPSLTGIPNPELAAVLALEVLQRTDINAWERVLTEQESEHLGGPISDAYDGWTSKELVSALTTCVTDMYLVHHPRPIPNRPSVRQSIIGESQ